MHLIACPSARKHGKQADRLQLIKTGKEKFSHLSIYYIIPCSNNGEFSLSKPWRIFDDCLFDIAGMPANPNWIQTINFSEISFVPGYLSLLCGLMVTSVGDFVHICPLYVTCICVGMPPPVNTHQLHITSRNRCNILVHNALGRKRTCLDLNYEDKYRVFQANWMLKQIYQVHAPQEGKPDWQFRSCKAIFYDDDW